MVSNAKVNLKRVKSILISQPEPKRSPFFDLAKKYGIQIDFRKFIQVEPVPLKEFRKQKVKLEDYSSVILTSKNAVDHLFRLCKEMRYKMPQDTKYFCMSEAIALYLQKFIVYRKRKVFFGKRTIEDLKTSLNKHKDKETFLMPCSNLGKKSVAAFLTKSGFNYQESMMYQTVSSDLSDLADIKYDMLVFYSPLGIKSLFENFSDFSQDETRIAAYGALTCKAVTDRGLTLNVKAPLPEVPSMTMAIERYLQESNKE